MTVALCACDAVMSFSVAVSRRAQVDGVEEASVAAVLVKEEDVKAARAEAEAQLLRERIEKEAMESKEATRRAGAELLRCHKLFVNEVCCQALMM